MFPAFLLAVTCFTFSFAPALNTEVSYRRIAVVLMMTVFFAQTFSSCFVIADYYTNTQAFAEACVNKASPELHCNGKCQMRRQIGNEEKKDQQAPERKDNKNEIVLSVHSAAEFIFHPFSETISRYPSLAVGKELKMPRILLRPPIA